MLNEIDIHGMRVLEARTMLDRYLATLPKGIYELSVVHGYRGGTALQNFVRKQYHHPRVLRTMLSLNPGETVLVLKDK